VRWRRRPRKRRRRVKKLILMSILIATFAIPFVFSARQLEPRRAVRIVQKRFVWFCVFYVLAVCYVMPRL
jgi:hypothetical protein